MLISIHELLPLEEKEENQPSGLIEQLSILGDIGFLNVDCYYKYGVFAVFGGTK